MKTNGYGWSLRKQGAFTGIALLIEGTLGLAQFAQAEEDPPPQVSTAPANGSASKPNMRVIAMSVATIISTAGNLFPLFAGGIPRDIAIGNLQDNIAAVHEKMNSDPDLVNRLTVVQMAVPIGDRPEVLSLLEYVIERSTNPASVEDATNALQLCVARHGAQIKKERFPEIANNLQRGLKQTKDLRIKLEVADTLPKLGMGYRNTSYLIHLNILSDPGPLISREDNALFLRALEEVVETNQRGSKEKALQAIQEFKVRDYIVNQIRNYKGQMLEASYRRDLAFVDALISRDTEPQTTK